MANKVQSIVPYVGRLNWDDDLSVMPSGDGRERHNIEINEVGKYGKVLNFLGDTQIDLSLTADQIVIGSCFDTKRDQYVVIVGGINGTTHYIKGIDKSTRIVTNILSSDLLFENGIVDASGGYVYADCKIVDDMLIWVDGLNENKCIDLVKALNYTNRSGHGFTTVYIDQSVYGNNTIAINTTPYSYVNGDEVYLVLNDDEDNILYGGYGLVGVNTVPMSVSIGRSLDDDTVTVTGTAYPYEGDDQIYRLTLESITWMHASPKNRPSQISTFDPEKNDISLKNDSRTFQFAYSFVYYDNTESVLSCLSEEAVNQDQLFEDSSGSDFNCIYLQLNIDRPNVKRVRLYAREILEGVSNFYLIEDISRSDFYGNVYTYKFYGQIGSLASTNNQSLTLQDYIPNISETCDVINRNVLVCAGNTEGYEKVSPSVITEWKLDYKTPDLIVDVTNSGTHTGTDVDQVLLGDDYLQINSISITGVTMGNSDNGYLYWDLVIYEGYPSGYYEIYFYKDSGMLNSVAVAAGMPINTQSTAVIVELNSSGIGGSLTVNNVTTINDSGILQTSSAVIKYVEVPTVTNNYIYKFEFTYNIESITIYVPSMYSSRQSLAEYIVYAANKNLNSDYVWYDENLGICSLYTSVMTLTVIERANGFRSGGFIDNSTYTFIINYFDQLGRLIAVTNPFSCLIPYLTTREDTQTLSVYSTDRIGINTTINHNPPANADTYSFAVARNNKYWGHFYVDDVLVWDADTNKSITDVISYTGNPKKTNLVAIAINRFALDNGLPVYEYTEGDSIRIVGYVSNQYSYYTNVKMNCLIQGSDTTEDGNTILFIDEQVWDSMRIKLNNGSTPDYFILEIYHNYSNSEDERLFLECSQRYSTVEIGGITYHQNGTSTLHTITEGNAFYIGGFNNELDNCFIKLPYSSLSSKMDSRQWGKPIAIKDLSDIRYYNNVRSGGKLYENTNTNNLFKFDYDDVVYLNDTNGNIKRISARENVLRVGQERKLTSIYIGGTEVSTQTGETQIYRSDKTLGSTRESSDNYGVQVKTAWVSTGDSIYFWDINNGCILRDTNGGIIPIVGRTNIGQYSNDFKMDRYFKELSKNVTNLNNFNISVGFDYHNRLVFIGSSFEDTDYATVVFSEKHDYWYTFYSAFGRMFINGNLETCYVDTDGDIYVMFDNTTRCFIHGVQQDFVVDGVFNQEPLTQKSFEAISIKSSKRIDAELEIEPSPSYTYGMYSRIKEGKWRLEENIYRSEILRNMRLNDSTLSVKMLHSGDIMRGNAMVVTLTDDSTSLVEVQAMDVYYSTSSS